MERASCFHIRGECQGKLISVDISRDPYLLSSPFVPQADQDGSSSHDLAARTVAHLKAKASVDEDPASSTARFDLDEVSGPLKSARGTDGVVDIDDTYDEEIKEQEGAWTHKVKREYAEQVKVSYAAFHLSCCPKLNFVFLVSSTLRAPLLPVNPALKTASFVPHCTPSGRFL